MGGSFDLDLCFGQGPGSKQQGLKGLTRIE